MTAIFSTIYLIIGVVVSIYSVCRQCGRHYTGSGALTLVMIYILIWPIVLGLEIDHALNKRGSDE